MKAPGFTAVDIATMRMYRSKGWTLQAIADRYGITAQAVFYYVGRKKAA